MVSLVGKHMCLALRGFDGEQVAVHLSVARHHLPIDIVAQRLGDQTLSVVNVSITSIRLANWP